MDNNSTDIVITRFILRQYHNRRNLEKQIPTDSLYLIGFDSTIVPSHGPSVSQIVDPGAIGEVICSSGRRV